MKYYINFVIIISFRLIDYRLQEIDYRSEYNLLNRFSFLGIDYIFRLSDSHDNRYKLIDCKSINH